MRNEQKIFSLVPKRKRLLVNIAMDLKEIVCEIRSVFVSRYSSVVGFCEWGNENSSHFKRCGIS